MSVDLNKISTIRKVIHNKNSNQFWKDCLNKNRKRCKTVRLMFLLLCFTKGILKCLLIYNESERTLNIICVGF